MMLMQLEKEIDRAIRHISAKDTQGNLSKEALLELAEKVKDDAKNGSYYFEKNSIIVLQQNSKKRLVKRYENQYSTENVLCQCIKQILDDDFRIKYPNRNKISRALFSVLSAIIQMADFTIVRKDKKNYFNSVSAEYAFKKYIQNKISDRFMRNLIDEFCKKTEYTFAGFPTSNAIAEIIATEYDLLLERVFNSFGIVFYSRYIDDCVLILNKHVDEITIKRMLKDILSKVFADKEIDAKKRCKTTYNDHKYSYISKRTLTPAQKSFDFLGYEFLLNLSPEGKAEIKYGITQEKRIKYQKRIEYIIKQYSDPTSADYHDIELLRHRVLAFSSRVVYLNDKRKNNNWKVKGFISNYGELRYLTGTDALHSDTEKYLKELINEAFSRAGISTYFSHETGEINSGYNLFHNLQVNKTLLLVDGIGYDYKSLVELCGQINISNIDGNGKKRTYSSLVREYLIRIKIGY